MFVERILMAITVFLDLEEFNEKEQETTRSWIKKTT
jgi:hypothetical protein